MGLFQDISKALFGGDSKSAGTSNTTQNQTQSQNQTQHQTGGVTQYADKAGSAAQSGVSTVSSLDEGTLASLKNLLPQLLSGVAASGANSDAATIRSLSSSLAGRSGTNVEGDIAALQTEARSDFAQNEGANINLVQQQIGSKGNSYSSLLESAGNANLEAKLGGIAAQVRANARTQSDSEIASAIEGFTKASSVGAAATAAPLQNLLAVIQSLEGASTTTATTGATTSSEKDSSAQFSDLISTLNALATSNATGIASTTGKNVANNGWLNNIVGLFK